MWPFKRKARNRRNEREGVLEVKMRSRAARGARVRVITAAVSIVGSAALGALLVWQGYQWALQRLVYTNEAFNIRRIELRHEGRLRPEQIKHWAGVGVGQNLLAVDLDRVRHELEMNPWIARAEVEAMRPDCLRIAVFEREPVAQLVVWRFNLADRHAWSETNLVDRQGFVMPPLRSESLRPGVSGDFSHLTRLTGIDHRDINPGHRLSHPGVPSALALIRAYQESSMYNLVDLDEVDVSQVELLTGQLRQGTRVQFGVEGFDRQMRRWRSIHDHAVSVGRDLSWLDLSVTNNLPARWMDATNAPVPVKPQSKPPRPGKHHV